MLFRLVTLETSQPERGERSVREAQPENIQDMSVTFDVSQLERPGMDVRLPQPSNMYAMLVTSEMSRFVTSMVEASTPS